LAKPLLTVTNRWTAKPKQSKHGTGGWTINIDVRIKQLIAELAQVRNECEILIERTHTYEEDLLKVKTEEQARAFDNTHDIEEGLSHIRLF
jgi:predicted metal-dependent peptidase